MGMDRTIRFSSEAVPGWPAIKAQLARVGETGELRMIDGMPAFPQTTHVSVSGPRRTLTIPARVPTRSSRQSAGGVIETASGNVSAEQFARESDIAPE